MSRAPIESVPWSSVFGAQCDPPSVDFQTPPSAPPVNRSPFGATATAVTRPATHWSPAPEVLKLLVGSMYWGESEKSTPSPDEGLVRSVQRPPVTGSFAASPATAANASSATAPFGARRWPANQSAAAAAFWLSSPAAWFGDPLGAAVT